MSENRLLVPPLHTPRLTLRPYEPADAPAFFALLEANRPRLTQSFPARLKLVRTLADATRLLARFHRDWRYRHLYVLGIWESASGRYLGDISLMPNWAEPVTLEIGYYLAADAEGQGFAREALAAAVAFGFGLQPPVARLLIRCEASNPRSCAVAEHAGFQLLPPRPRLWPLGRREGAIHYYMLRRPA